MRLSKEVSKEVKKQVSIPQFYRYKGYPFSEEVEKNGGRFSCQIHGPDHNPSAFYNTKSDTMFCFACHFCGDVLAVIQKMENLTFKEALAFIYTTFKLDLSETILTEVEESFYQDNYRKSIIDEFEPFLWRYIDETGDMSVLPKVNELYSIQDNNIFYKAISKFKEEIYGKRV